MLVESSRRVQMKKLIVVIAMPSAFISAPVLEESIDSAGVNRDTQ